MAKQNTQETIIAHGVRVEGAFVSQGDVLIEGEVFGTVETASDLRVGEQSNIQANVKAKNALVSGNITGNVVVSGRLELTATARITGDISAEILAVAAGAAVNGAVSMGAKGKKGKDEGLEVDE